MKERLENCANYAYSANHPPALERLAVLSHRYLCESGGDAYIFAVSVV